MNNYLDNVETLIIKKLFFDTSFDFEMNLNHNVFNLKSMPTNQT